MYQHLSCSICSKGQWWEMMVIRCPWEQDSCPLQGGSHSG